MFCYSRFWSKSSFTNQTMCDTLVNNISETFNNVIIKAKRKLIILTMLEEIRLH